MEGIVIVRALGLVAVMVIFCGVAEANNPCYAECFKDCVTPVPCAYNPMCIETCGITCSVQDTCNHVSRKVLRNFAKSEEAVKIQNYAIEKHSVGALEGNPCYADCVQDCFNSCSFLGCAACPAICGTHDTCEHKKTIEINSGKEEVEIQSHTIEKNSVGVVGGNPCYADCVQSCLNNCGLSPIGCASCPVICGMHDTCKNIEINSGNIVKSHVGLEARHTIGQNSVACE